MKRTIAAVLTFILCLPLLSLAEMDAQQETLRAALQGYGIEMDIPDGWQAIDGKAAYNTQSVDFAELNFPISAHMVFTEGDSGNLLHAFLVPEEALASGDLIASLETVAGENGVWYELDGLSFFVFVDVENALCCAVARVASSIVVLVAQPIDDPVFIEAFDGILATARLSGTAPQ